MVALPAAPRRQAVFVGCGRVKRMAMSSDALSDDQPLLESEVPSDPTELFGRWFEEACQRNNAGWLDPTAMTLATVDAEGMPVARVVLLKSFDARGFVFFTNYDSDKGRQLAAHPHAALVMHWPHLRRQVRVVGSVGLVTRAESEAYFNTRPLGSRVSAIVSPQSRVVAGREALELAVRAHQEQGREAVCPARWGGYRVQPEAIEFWQGRENRLHDRLRYMRDDDTWGLQRLAP